MQVNSEDLFSHIGHLTIENKILYNHIETLEAKIIELEKDNIEDSEVSETSDIRLPTSTER